jgi:hypothetical protein
LALAVIDIDKEIKEKNEEKFHSIKKQRVKSEKKMFSALSVFFSFVATKIKCFGKLFDKRHVTFNSLSLII